MNYVKHFTRKMFAINLAINVVKKFIMISIKKKESMVSELYDSIDNDARQGIQKPDG